MKSAEQETKIQKVQTTDDNEKISGLSKISSKKMKTNHGNNNNNNINNNINNNDGEENEAQGHKFSWKDRLAANKNILSLASPALIDKIGGETQNPSSNVLVNSESAVAETEIISRGQKISDKSSVDDNDDDGQELDYDDDESGDLTRNLGQDEEIVGIGGNSETLPPGQVQ